MGFWTGDLVLREGLPQEEVRVFKPMISAGEADRRFAKWNLAVQASYGLSALSEDT